MATRYKSKETLLVITTGFLAIGLLSHRPLFLYIALGIGCIGILSTYLSDKIDWGWTKLSLILGMVSNTILLTLVFILVVLPVGLLRKRRMIRFDPGKTSNFIGRDHTFTKEDMEHTW